MVLIAFLSQFVADANGALFRAPSGENFRFETFSLVRLNTDVVAPGTGEPTGGSVKYATLLVGLWLVSFAARRRRLITKNYGAS